MKDAGIPSTATLPLRLRADAALDGAEHEPAITAPSVAFRLRAVRSPRNSGTDAVALRAIADRMNELVEENESLTRELSRCHEQLGLLLDATDDVMRLEDPAVIEDMLLRRFARMVGAAAVVIERHSSARVAWLASNARDIEGLTTDAIRGALADELALVRERGRSRCVEGMSATTASIAGVHALLGWLRSGDDDGAAVISLRSKTQPPFDEADRWMGDCMLVFGGQILAGTRMRKRVERSALETVCALANVIEARDPYTSGHSERVAWLARQTGQALDLSAQEQQDLEWAGRLHDVGKIAIAERILNKPGALTELEFEQIKQHPRISFEMLRPVSALSPWLLDAVLHHHEDYDGKGYPERLAGDHIPLGARILRVVDMFDALTSTRPYRKGKSLDEAAALLRSDAGRAIDPRVTRVFLKMLEELQIRPSGEFRRLFAHCLTIS